MRHKLEEYEKDINSMRLVVENMLPASINNKKDRSLLLQSLNCTFRLMHFENGKNNYAY